MSWTTKDLKKRKGSQRITVYRLLEEKNGLKITQDLLAKRHQYSYGRGADTKSWDDAEQVREMAKLAATLAAWWAFKMAYKRCQNDFTPDTVRLVLSKIEDLQQEPGGTMSQARNCIQER